MENTKTRVTLELETSTLTAIENATFPRRIDDWIEQACLNQLQTEAEQAGVPLTDPPLPPPGPPVTAGWFGLPVNAIINSLRRP